MESSVGPIQLIFVLGFLTFFIVCYWRIWSKAGFHGAWSLLMLVPLINFLAIAYLAFAKWPVSDSQVAPSTFD